MKPEERLVVKRSFDLMFRSGLNFSQAIAKIRQEYPTGLGAEFADFVDKSGRGICRLRQYQRELIRLGEKLPALLAAQRGEGNGIPE